MKSKINKGNFFEDFKLGQILNHATPRTINAGDVALYIALTGSRYSQFSSSEFAKNCGLNGDIIDPLLVFHVVFGKTVPDISLNAVANLGYAECVFHKAVLVGDTLRSVSEVIGLKENSNGKTGVVYVRTKGFNQNSELVLSYVRWVMVNKKDFDAKTDEAVPELQKSLAGAQLIAPSELADGAWNCALSGSKFAFEDYEIGEKIDHIDGMAIEEAEHQMATRLYQNTAKVHFDAFAQKSSRFGRRLVYGGVVISTARAICFNGLENAGHLLAINGGRHVNPYFAGDTIYAHSEILEKAEIGGNWGALRLKTIATKDLPCVELPIKDGEDNYLPNVILDLDYWVAIPMKSSIGA